MEGFGLHKATHKQKKNKQIPHLELKMGTYFTTQYKVQCCPMSLHATH